jgi:hypothetical protein
MAAKKKTTKGKRKRSARKVAICELSDPPWRRLAKVYRQLLQQSEKYAAKDLMEALKNGKLRCVRRIEKDPKYCEEVSAKFWRSLKFHERFYFERLLGTHDPEFYVEQPWEVLPVPAPQVTKESEPEVLGRKPGRKPKVKWKMFVAAKAWETHKGRQPAAYFAQLCENEFKWQPDISEINKWLSVLDYYSP